MWFSLKTKTSKKNSSYIFVFSNQISFWICIVDILSSENWGSTNNSLRNVQRSVKKKIIHKHKNVAVNNISVAKVQSILTSFSWFLIMSNVNYSTAFAHQVNFCKAISFIFTRLTHTILFVMQINNSTGILFWVSRGERLSS